MKPPDTLLGEMVMWKIMSLCRYVLNFMFQRVQDNNCHGKSLFSSLTHYTIWPAGGGVASCIHQRCSEISLRARGLKGAQTTK